MIKSFYFDTPTVLCTFFTYSHARIGLRIDAVQAFEDDTSYPDKMIRLTAIRPYVFQRTLVHVEMGAKKVVGK